MPPIEPQSTIWSAAKQGRLAEVQQFVAEGTSIDARARGEITPLHEASEGGHLDVVHWLLEQGADPNARTRREPGDAGSYCPLHLAVRRGHIEIASLLIERGAKIDAKMSDGTTPLMLVAETKRLDLAQLLLSNGADINFQNQVGVDAFSIALLSGALELSHVLISKGADVNQEIGPSGENILMTVCCNKDLEAVRFLVKHHADVFAADAQGRTALHHALTSAAVHVREWHSSEKVTTCKEDSVDDALEIVKLLIAAGVDTRANNNDGQTPLALARKLKLTRFIELLESVESNAIDKAHIPPSVS